MPVAGSRTGMLVSVLDLDNATGPTHAGAANAPHTRGASGADVSLSTMSMRPTGRPDASADAPGGHVVGVMVEPIGIEPMTLCLQSRCSPS